MRRATVVATVLAMGGAVTAAVASPPVRTPRPVFASYAAPSGMGDDAGEPTLGWHAKTNSVLFQSGSRTLRVTGLDGRGGAAWKDVSPLVPGLYTFDPILETDERTGRTWTSQLDLYCSRMAYTDDAGANWTQLPAGCGLGALFDHQSVGVGKFRNPADPDDYPNAVYYCAQTTMTANCSVSTDGGFLFGPARIAWTSTQCSTSHGHVKSAPDGTTYLPSFDCDGKAGFGRTRDNGATWTVHTVPGSTIGDAMHPSMHAGSDGTVYFGWGGKPGPGPGGPPYAAVSRDAGTTWSKPVRLGAELGVIQTRFVTTVAGDGDRAAIAYLGSKTAGDSSDPSFLGAWHLYVSFTYDRGKTWSTVNATPKHPVQVGAICTSGTLCDANRNLLDFNDVVIDGRGRVLAAIADGCPGNGPCTPAQRGAKATIVRQEAGRGLLRKYSP